jgi:hypothetical protein
LLTLLLLRSVVAVSAGAAVLTELSRVSNHAAGKARADSPFAIQSCIPVCGQRESTSSQLRQQMFVCTLSG